MQSNCPRVMFALRGSSRGNASGRYFSVKTFVFKPVGDLVLKLLEHDPAGNAGKRLAGGRHVRVRIAMRPAEILFEDEIPVADHQQPAILSATLGEVVRLIEPRESMPASWRT